MESVTSAESSAEMTTMMKDPSDRSMPVGAPLSHTGGGVLQRMGGHVAGQFGGFHPFLVQNL
jgi:hypothetical protein